MSVRGIIYTLSGRGMLPPRCSVFHKHRISSFKLILGILYKALNTSESPQHKVFKRLPSACNCPGGQTPQQMASSAGLLS